MTATRFDNAMAMILAHGQKLGLVLPWTVVFVAPSTGGVAILRKTDQGHEVVASEGSLDPPMSVVIVDARNEAARFVIEPGDGLMAIN